MNKAKWRDPAIPMSVMALKLCEEAGEVAAEITDVFMAGKKVLSPALQHDNLLEELDHVILIAEIMKGRVRAGLDR